MLLLTLQKIEEFVNLVKLNLTLQQNFTFMDQLSGMDILQNMNYIIKQLLSFVQLYYVR